MAAREVNEIQQQIIDALVAKAAAAGITITPEEWSDYDYRQLLTYAAAVADGTLEQNFDIAIGFAEAIVRAAAPQTQAWLQKEMKLFQFDSTTPQIVQLDTNGIAGEAPTFAPYYPTEDPNLQVIKYCTVVKGSNGTTIIKVAAQVAGAPADLDSTHAGALAAAQSYANVLLVPGMEYVVRSGASDKLAVTADVYYQGGYSAVISPTTIAAIEAYLGGIPFNGAVYLSDLESAIKAVPGVRDVVFREVRARANATAYADATRLVNDSRTELRKWDTVSGYIVGETTASYTLADTLNFIPE